MLRGVAVLLKRRRVGILITCWQPAVLLAGLCGSQSLQFFEICFCSSCFLFSLFGVDLICGLASEEAFYGLIVSSCNLPAILSPQAPLSLVYLVTVMTSPIQTFWLGYAGRRQQLFLPFHICHLSMFY